MNRSIKVAIVAFITAALVIFGVLSAFREIASLFRPVC